MQIDQSIEQNTQQFRQFSGTTDGNGFSLARGISDYFNTVNTMPLNPEAREFQPNGLTHTTNNIPSPAVSNNNSFSNNGLPNIPINNGELQTTKEIQQVGGITEEASLASEITTGASTVLPILNNVISTQLNEATMQRAMSGQGEFGNAIGHQIVDQQNFHNAQIGSAIGSTMMAAGLMTGNPITAGVGLAAGLAADTLIPQAMENDQVVNATSGNLVTPQ